MAAVSVLLALLIGWLLTGLLLPATLRPRWAARLLQAALGIGAGIGVTSCIFFLLLLAHASSAGMIFSADLLALAIAVGLHWLRRLRQAPLGAPATTNQRPRLRWAWLLGPALAAALALAIAGILATVRANPNGQWDAWAIWNAKAKFLAGPGDTWRNVVSPLLEGHPFYPLLLPGFIARVWKASGGESVAVPVATAVLYFLGNLALLIAAVALLRTLSAALLAALVLLTNTSFVFLTTMQYADLPLSFYYLAALALVLLSAASEPAGANRVLAASGVFASLAAWTKNEGLIFLALILACYLLVQWRASGLTPALARWRYLLLGALPALLLVVCFKLFLAPPTDPAFHQTAAQVLRKLADFSRYTRLGAALSSQALQLGAGISNPLLLLAILAVTLRFRLEPERKPAVLFAALTLALVFGAYCGAYIASPYDLAWQLETSLPRLCAQLWPSFLLLAFVLLAAPEHTCVPVPSKKARA